MPAPRYTDWTHTRVIGAPPEAGKPYLGEARKLLGFVFEEAARNALGVHQITRKLADGTVIVAEKFGDIPRITIYPVVGGGERTVTELDDFVVWARDTTYPAGIDVDHPQQILRPKPKWRTFFFSGTTTGHDAFPGAKGTYIGTFPDGVTLAGNIDWINRFKERFSWYGPSARYWYDGFRQPRAQYGKHVFCLGQKLLDVDAYCTDSSVSLAERYVMGACMVGSWLYAVLADLPASVTWPAAPATATVPNDAWASPIYPTGNIALALVRFGVGTNPALPGPMKYVINANSHETLWSGSGPRAVAPWHFGPDGKTAVAHAPPANAQLTYRNTAWSYPSASHSRMTLTVADDGTTADFVETPVVLGSGLGASAVIAEDGERALELVRLAGSDGHNNSLFYRMGAHDYLALGANNHAPDNFYYRRRQIMWADLRENILLLEEVESRYVGGPTPDVFVLRHVLCQNGAETEIHRYDESGNLGSIAEGMKMALDRLNDGAIAPLAVMHLHAFGSGFQTGLFEDLGAGLLFAQLLNPFRKADTFGQTRAANFIGAWDFVLDRVDRASDTAANQQTDSLGHTTNPGIASRDGVTVASYNTNWYLGADELVVNHATGSTLPDLTGVAGAQARYHPIWILGKPSRHETTTP